MLKSLFFLKFKRWSDLTAGTASEGTGGHYPGNTSPYKQFSKGCCCHWASRPPHPSLHLRSVKEMWCWTRQKLSLTEGEKGRCNSAYHDALLRSQNNSRLTLYTGRRRMRRRQPWRAQRRPLPPTNLVTFTTRRVEDIAPVVTPTLTPS